MTAAKLMGLVFRLDKDDDLAQAIRDGVDAYYVRFGIEPLYCAVHPGTVVIQDTTTVEIVERQYIRANHILVGRFVE
jgi:hypothetical protein